MNCLQVDISLLSNCLCAEVTNFGDGLKLEVNNLSGLLANVNLYNDYIKPIVSDYAGSEPQLIFCSEFI